MTHRVRAAVIALALSLALVLPSAASAGMDSIANGTIGTGGAIGPKHSLTSVWATWFAGASTAFNAINEDGTWAGTTYYATPGDVNVGHIYCGCALRYGWGAAAWGTTTAYVRQFW